MKTLKLTSIMFLLLLPISVTTAQEKNDALSSFLISIQSNNNTVKLTCKEGFAWKELTYNIEDEKPTQGIDALGMTDDIKNQSKLTPELADFYFTIEKTENGLSLRSDRGTAWTDLSFNFAKENDEKTIDESGMKENK